MLQCGAVCCSVVQCVAVWCSVLQFILPRCQKTENSDQDPFLCRTSAGITCTKNASFLRYSARLWSLFAIPAARETEQCVIQLYEYKNIHPKSISIQQMLYSCGTVLVCGLYLQFLQRERKMNASYNMYGVATISRLLKIVGLFCRIYSLL